MRYEEFRLRLEEALREVDLVSFALPSETIDLFGPVRRFRAYVNPSVQAEPLSISGRVSFRWGPFEAARSFTCEEDLLTELYDRSDSEHHKETAPRLLRVDLGLYAKLPYGSTTPMPAPELWSSWSASLGAALDGWLPRAVMEEERRPLPAVIGWRSDLQLESRISMDGTLVFDGISVLAYRLIQIPRMWDDPEKSDREDDSSEAVHELTRRFKGALETWQKAAAELGRWIKYGPPADVRKDPFARLDEDEDPEVTH